MKPNEIVKEVEKLELSEKLILVEDIRDSIAKHNAVLPMPEWQKSELKKRYSEYNKMELVDYDKLIQWIANISKI